MEMQNNFDFIHKKERRTTIVKISMYALIGTLLYVIIMLSLSIPSIITLLLYVFLGISAIFTISSIVEILRLEKSKGRYAYRLGNGLAFFDKKDMKMCAKMAANGYSLVSVDSMGFYKFELSQPEDWIYSVDFSDEKPGNESYDDYIAIFESSGWTHVFGGCDGIHFFRASRGTTPIYTDNESLASKYERMRSISIWSVVLSSIAAVVAFLAAHFIPNVLSDVFYLLAGAGAGLAIAMAVGIILNHLRVIRLRTKS